MGTGRTNEFRKEAVRIALTSGLSRRQVADDLGVGFSTLNKWVSAHRGTDVVSAKDRDLARENERFRREVRILKEERDIPKKSPPVLREPKAVRFRFVEEQSGTFPIDRLCRVMNVSPRGLRAFRKRPASIRSERAFFRSSIRPPLANRCCGSRPARSWSSNALSIAISKGPSISSI